MLRLRNIPLEEGKLFDFCLFLLFGQWFFITTEWCLVNLNYYYIQGTNLFLNAENLVAGPQDFVVAGSEFRGLVIIIMFTLLTY